MQITYIEYDLPVDDVLASTCGFRTWAERHGFVLVARVGECLALPIANYYHQPFTDSRNLLYY